MTTFPFIALGTVVLYEGKEFVVSKVDYTEKTFDIRRIKETPARVVHGLSFREYVPAPTIANFERMVDEWDYYYQMSDDERVVEKGREQLAEMAAMFKKLDTAEQHYFQKIVAVVQHIVNP